MRIWRAPDGRIRWTWRFITYIVLMFVALGLSQGLVYFLLRRTPPAVSQPIMALAMVLSIYGLTWLWRTRLDRRPMAGLGLSRGSAGQFALGFLVGGGAMTLVALVGAAAGWVQFAGWETETASVGSVLGGLAVALAPNLAVGFSEELAMRGYVQANFSEGRPAWLAVLWTGLVFAVLHGLNFSALLPYMIFILSATAMSVALSTWRIRTGALWMPIGFHAAWNWTQFDVLGFTLNQRPDYRHTLVHLDIQGPQLWLGAPGMPEGGLLTLLVVMVLAAAAVLVAGRRIVWR